ncbi:serine/threonine protein kinase [Paenibacillus spongiae]|uniref:non-specific serine/threonine protein kinase n=1 Tax=Paenibacillus spongiae TaxID=2909671 RepID=A0ABY5S480_9BACL|nr:serine/threonine-protein kinase [Paenibacillus spongiae]UVI27672.1 serine/threonine protein kinase [Paenibacillus spongiae]
MNQEQTGRYVMGDAVGGGRYRIVGMLGKGGMGEVYAAEDSRLQGKLRALKVNRPPSEDGLFHAEEAVMLMRLNHPNLPLIVDYYPPDELGAEILVMDYIDGVTLQAHLEIHHGKVALMEIIRTGLQLCQALIYLHSQYPPIIHRDLKPTNVMIDRSGHVRLIDFGIARRYKADAGQDTVQLGTPGFAAPEQEGAGQSDARTDIFGLGALIYYLLSGGHPPASYSASIAQLPSSVPEPLLTVIGRMLERHPRLRYSSMQEASEALQACLDSLFTHPIARQSDAPWNQEGLGNERTNRRMAQIKPDRRQQSADRRSDNKPLHIAVASLAPCSGGTFVAITLAKLLGLRGVECAAFEHPSLSPEWHALLDCSRSRKHAAHSGDSVPDPRYIRYGDAHVSWHVLQPEQADALADESIKYRLMVEAYPNHAKVTDVSSHWKTEASLETFLLSADVVLFVADPHAYKWSAARLAAAERIRFERSAAGLPTWWLANKDMRFQGRAEWLSLLPAQPIAAIPQLPMEEWLQLLWQGKWMTSDRKLLAVMEKAFQPLLRKLFE